MIVLFITSYYFTDKNNINSHKDNNDNTNYPKSPILAVDSIITKKEGDIIYILMIERGYFPFGLAFPGGHVDYGEQCENAVLRELKEECSLTGKNPKLFGVYSEPNRDPRKHVVSIVYEVDVDDLSTLKAGDDAKAANWFDIKELVKNPEKIDFDHHKIISDYLKQKKLA
jgi:ADP-ribose pyrophosphatase YjhB (NUDIX family)